MKKNYWEGNNIRLRAVEEKDLQRCIARRNSPDSMGDLCEDCISFPESETDLKKRFAENAEEYSKNDKRIFIIETLEEDFVGEISVWFTQRKAGVFRYGIVLDEKYRRKGYGKEALIIVLDYYFNELNYQKCSPTVYGFNKNSQAFHEHFGFVLEGRLRNDVYARGRYYDMLYYGMLKNEFNEFYKHDFII